MKYMGSKRKIAKEILPIILKDRKEDQWYVEPFVGGCNSIRHVKGKRLGSDIHPELIALYKALQEGWIPPTSLSEEEYLAIKKGTTEVIAKYGDKLQALRGIVGFAYSYSGKYFGGYCRGKTAKGEPRDYIREGWNNVMSDVPFIQDIVFTCSSYSELDIRENSIVYCDPPYKGTTKYTTNNFNYNFFYEWLFNLKTKGHSIFISEYSMPDDFTCIWQKETSVSIDSNRVSGDTRIEKLFTIV